MSIILAGFSSAVVALLASRERGRTKKEREFIESLNTIPVVPICCLKSILPHQDAKKLVFVRGHAMPRSVTDIGQSSPSSSSSESSGLEVNSLRSSRTNEEALVIEKRTVHIFYQQSAHLNGNGRKYYEEEKVVSSTRQQVTFVLVDHVKKPCAEYVTVNTADLDNQVPLQRVYHERKELYNHQVDRCCRLHVDFMEEENILPLGSCLTAVGIVSWENGVLSIKPYEGLRCFLTSKSKEELIAELTADVTAKSDKSRVLSTISVGLAGYAITALAIRFIRNLCE